MKRRLDHLPVPSDRAMRVLKWVVIVAVVIFIGWLLVGMARLGQTAESNAQALETARAERAELDRRVDEQGATIDKQDDAIGTANRRLKGAGKKPVVVPDQPAAVPKIDGQPVLTSDDVLTLIEAEVKVQHPDLTATQKRELVDAAAVKAAARIPEPEDGTDAPTLADLRPVIRAEVAKIPAPEDGQDGQDGSTPTGEEVAAAITTLCGGTCRGPQGEPGPSGADSMVPGPQGPPGADSTVPGPKGETGDAGADGRGITAVTCETDGTWTFTFSDDTTSTVAGPCRAPEPEPEPTPEPTTTSEPAPTTTTGATP